LKQRGESHDAASELTDIRRALLSRRAPIH
jgi:hypothetical protein